MAQWLRPCTPNVGGLDSVPGLGTRPHLLQLRGQMLKLEKTKKKKKTPHATTEDPA